jgi:hypothetical protein
MRIQRKINFLHYRWGKPVVPDHDHGLAAVCQTLEMLPLCGRERFHADSLN